MNICTPWLTSLTMKVKFTTTENWSVIGTFLMSLLGELFMYFVLTVTYTGHVETKSYDYTEKSFLVFLCIFVMHAVITRVSNIGIKNFSPRCEFLLPYGTINSIKCITEED